MSREAPAFRPGRFTARRVAVVCRSPANVIYEVFQPATAPGGARVLATKDTLAAALKSAKAHALLAGNVDIKKVVKTCSTVVRV